MTLSMMILSHYYQVLHIPSKAPQNRTPASAIESSCCPFRTHQPEQCYKSFLGQSPGFLWVRSRRTVAIFALLRWSSLCWEQLRLELVRIQTHTLLLADVRIELSQPLSSELQLTISVQAISHMAFMLSSPLPITPPGWVVTAISPP